ncbi:MAG: SCP2 sterol-binding domain-containing protein [Defluviitaleaceae bacterium]|nr:SCP2 sterol-binding domain-containing protein [Defluviitaleaceae bacterium]
MKITAIYAPSGPDFGLNTALDVVCDTLMELGENVASVDLSAAALTYYDGKPSNTARYLMDGLKDADGLIFACSAVFHAPSALMHTFLEYFQDENYRSLVKQKNCLLLTFSQDSGERAAAEQLSRILSSLGAIDVVRISLDASVADVADGHVTELIERQTEDFYRILRQNRRYILSQKKNPIKILGPNDARNIVDANMRNLYEKHNLGNINETAQMDINKIVAMYTKKHGINEEVDADGAAAPLVASSPKSCKQLTASLPHYFNPQLTKDMEVTIQLDISDDDGFLGHLVIANQGCVFHEGGADRNDIIIMTDAKTWADVLKGKITAQKAFMIGKLKVRGSFALLTKFDQLFNKIP